MKSGELSIHCFRALYDIERSPQPAQRFNPGVCRKLVTDGFATNEMLPSPYRQSRGSAISHLQITDKGRERLARSTL